MAQKAMIRKLATIQRDVGRLRDAVDALYKDLDDTSEQVKTAPQATRLGDALQFLGHAAYHLEKAGEMTYQIKLPSL